MPMTFVEYLTSPYVWALVAVVWLVTSAVVKVAKLHYRHVERLAMIDRGMHPDESDE